MLSLGLLVRLASASPLWLDEAQSVHLATLPLRDLRRGLQQDGAPPLYYLVLHAWTSAFGTSDEVVRLPSVLCSVATLAVVWHLGRRLTGDGTAAVLVLASLPFAVRYATETRMYALVMLLVALGGVALEAAWRRPDLRRLLGVAGSSGALLLTHYWAFFLLAVVGATLLVLRRWRLAVSVAGGLVLFAPWVPTFLQQARHTGTPWATPPTASQVLGSLLQWGGPASIASQLCGLALVAAIVVGLLGTRGEAGLVLGRPVPAATLLTAVGLGTIVLGVVVSAATRNGYPVRYSSVAVVPVVLVVARTRVLAPPLLWLTVVAGLVSSVPIPFDATRTQAARLVAAMDLAPGDAVVVCPDQLGPAVARLVPPGTTTLAYPSLTAADGVDWTDYAQRQAAADPAAIAASVADRVTGRIWLVEQDGYRTFGHQCSQLVSDLAQRRSGRTLVQAASTRFAERANLVRFDARS